MNNDQDDELLKNECLTLWYHRKIKLLKYLPHLPIENEYPKIAQISSEVIPFVKETRYQDTLKLLDKQHQAWVEIFYNKIEW